MTIAPSVRFRQLVENALTHLSWFDPACGQLGLTGISQIWDEEPAWYFWLKGRSYLLRYAGGEEDAAELTAVLHAFPTREECADGRSFASGQPVLIEGQFDFATMTPCFESFALFKEAFIAGELTFWLANGELRLLAVSGYDRQWESVWSFTEFLVAMLAFQRRAEPAGAPYQFSPQGGIATVLVPFAATGSVMARALMADHSYRRLPAPKAWQRLAREQVRCSAAGICACSQEH